MLTKHRGKMISGYNHIYRQSDEHEPVIVGTRLTVARIVRDLTGPDAVTIDDILEPWEGRVTKEMINEALAYYSEHKIEIDTYIEESKKRSGTILRSDG